MSVPFSCRPLPEEAAVACVVQHASILCASSHQTFQIRPVEAVELIVGALAEDYGCILGEADDVRMPACHKRCIKAPPTEAQAKACGRKSSMACWMTGKNC